MDITTSCCFCGHRPNHLPWGYDEKSPLYKKARKQIKELIKKSIALGYTHFISGMALGVDMMCAEIVLALKKQYPYITLEGAIPCKNQNRFWKEQEVKRYNKILKKLDKVTYTFEGNYFAGCMSIRNNYMIDNSSKLIAVYSPSVKSGGTFTTISRANKLGKYVEIVEI